MCGIFAIFSSPLNDSDLRRELIKCSATLRHRGPDRSGYKIISRNNASVNLSHGIAHERLSIMDPESGEQPLESQNVILSVNGEIYNYKELYSSLRIPYSPQTRSD